MTESHAVGCVLVEWQFDAAAMVLLILPDAEELEWPPISGARVLADDDPARPLAKSTVQFIIQLVAQVVLKTDGLTQMSEPVFVSTIPARKIEVPNDGGDLLDKESSKSFLSFCLHQRISPEKTFHAR